MGQEVVDYGSAVDDGNGDALHIAFAKIDVGARFFTVIDKDLTAPPGGSPAPSIGDAYIVGGSATGDWSGHDGKVAVYGLGSTWRFISAVEGMTAWVQDENTPYRYSGSAWVAHSGTVYDFGFNIDTTPDGGDVLGRVRIGRAITIPADFSGASGGVQTNPDASYDIDIQDDAVSIGTLTIATDGSLTWVTTSNEAKSVAAGSEITFVAPSPSPAEASIAGGSFVILATIT